MATVAQAGRRADRLLDDRQRSRFHQLSAAEKLLFVKLMKELDTNLSESDGRITSRKGFVSLGRAIDAIFDSVEEQELGAMGRSMVKDVKDMMGVGAAYYRKMKPPKGGSFAAIREMVNNTMRIRLGINVDDGVVRHGYLDQLITSPGARTEIKKMVAKSVAAGIPMRKLEQQLRVKVQGTGKTAGVLERHIGGFVLDAYNVADAITNNEFAKRLDLRYFVYSGGLIETTREFCRKKNNQVFSTEEANRDWPKDPDLLKSKAEVDSGVVTDYIPLEDRGRWRCRHSLLYITEEEALRRRPDLRG